MNDKKAFTLIELLAVITIIGIITLITIPVVTKVMKSISDKVFTSNEKLLRIAAENYYKMDTSLLPSDVSDKIFISLDKLIEEGYSKPIKNPSDATIFCDGYVIVEKQAATKYVYKPYLNCGSQLYSVDYYENFIIDDTSLIGYWPLDGDALDLSSNNNHGTIYGAVPTTNQLGQAGKAMLFDGIDDYIDVGPSGVSLNITNTITISVWTKFDNVANGVRVGNIMGNYDLSPHFNLEGYTNGHVRFYYNGAEIDLVATNDLRGEWYHIAVVRDKMKNKSVIYINGSQVASAIAGTNKDIIWPLRIGKDFRTGTPIPFHGAIDNIHIYRKALTESEIKFIFDIESYVK